jgi:ATP-dependent helicase/DNAse subunit B
VSFLLLEKGVIKLEETDMNELWKQATDNRLQKLEQEVLLQGKDLEYVKQDLGEIKENTKWLRRAVTNAFIVALIGGAVAIFYGAFQLFKGGI